MGFATLSQALAKQADLSFDLDGRLPRIICNTRTWPSTAGHDRPLSGGLTPLQAYLDRLAARTVLVASQPFGWQNVGMQQRRRPPDLHRRSCLLAALPWLPVPALAADAPLREAMRRAEALRDEAQRAGDQPYGAVVLHGESLTDAGAPR